MTDKIKDIGDYSVKPSIKAKELRRRLGLSQKEIGVKIGVSERTIQRYESGESKIPDKHSSALAQLADRPHSNPYEVERDQYNLSLEVIVNSFSDVMSWEAQLNTGENVICIAALKHGEISFFVRNTFIDGFGYYYSGVGLMTEEEFVVMNDLADGARLLFGDRFEYLSVPGIGVTEQYSIPDMEKE